MCLNRKGKQCCMLEMSPEMRTISRTSRHRFGAEMALQPHCQGWCLKGVPEFRKGTQVGNDEQEGVLQLARRQLFILFIWGSCRQQRDSQRSISQTLEKPSPFLRYVSSSKLCQEYSVFSQRKWQPVTSIPLLIPKEKKRKNKKLFLAIRSSLHFPVAYTNVKSQPLMPSDFEELSNQSLKLCSFLS